MSNKTKVFLIAIALSGAVAMSSCTHSPNNTVTPGVSFSKDIIPIFTTSCALNGSCHLGANSYNLGVSLDAADAYNSIMAKRLVNTSTPTSSLLYVEVNDALMPKPPSAALPAAQQTLILQWIQQGAKND